MERHHRLRIARRMEWAHDIADYIEQFIELPPVSLPTISFDPDIAAEDDIERAAEIVRAHWKLGDGPIHAFTRILEANGILLICEDVSCDDMDAVSRWQGGRPYILYSQEVESGPRCMFNLAHELGHILLHSSCEVDSRNLDALESQANRFAGAFLLPRSRFSTEVVSTSIKYFEYLKERWGVSIAAMIYRCRDLALLSKHQHGYLMRQMNAMGLRLKEPLDDAFQPIRPMVLHEALKMLVDNAVQSKAQIESALSLNPRDIASLCGAPAAFLETKIVPFRLQPRGT
jgi:Zn-dependent peptidase ImmA (M78 family)